jgi:hypothetical protein
VSDGEQDRRHGGAPGRERGAGGATPDPDPAEAPVLPDRSPDDSDVGWGEQPGGRERDDDWYERERPPHW